MSQSPPDPPKNSPNPPKQTNWGLLILLSIIGVILYIAFGFGDGVGGTGKQMKLVEFTDLYREGTIVQNSQNRFPITVTTDSGGKEGVIKAHRYTTPPKAEYVKFNLPFTPDNKITEQFNRYGITKTLDSPAPVEGIGKTLKSSEELFRFGEEGRILLEGSDAPVIYEHGDKAVLVASYRKIPTGKVDRQNVTPVEVIFSIEFEGQKVQNLLGSRAQYKVDSNMWFSLFINLLPVAIILLLFFFIFRAQSGGPNAAMKFAKSRARLLDPKKNRVTFKDVAGVSEAKEEVWEIVEFLRNPQKFQDIGGTIPKGILMVGSPGTGKTLLARAIAGEADVPFFTISGSDFVEMFVGVGASRVRDMFTEAKRHSPCLIFIDEIDAVGRHRGHGVGGGHDEREQTLNAMLVEMDGFTANENVIVIAATNRVDVLDPALLRPGRFDRQVVVNLPDAAGREQILRVHVRKVKMDPTVDLNPIARATTGFSGAELANLVNEAALIAARLNKKQVEQSDLEEAREKVRWGRERRSLELTDKDKYMTAIHEAGHAICLLKTPLSQTLPLHKVTIIPRGPALGVTMMLPEEDKHSEHKSELLDYIVVAMGGRVAEEVIFGDISGGARGDIKSATDIARKMVCVYGMSEKLGPVEYGSNHGEVFLARDIAHSSRNFSERTAQTIDEEIQRIVEENYARSQAILRDSRERLLLIADKLMEFESLSGDQIKELLETGEMADPPRRDVPPPVPQDLLSPTESLS